MLAELKTILDIQEIDMKMIRLLRLRKERMKEIEQIDILRSELGLQLDEKNKEVEALTLEIQVLEEKIAEVNARLKKLEAQQGSVKKVDEFNALTQEMTHTERERINLEHKISDLVDRKNAEEEILVKIRDSLQASEASSLALQEEIRSTLEEIQAEGHNLFVEREAYVGQADEGVLKVYDRLLQHKKDRVIVPIENRICTGCHISLTAQHENIVRKSNNLVFCEHCSRIHYWPETVVQNTEETTKRRRKRKTA
jgi:predicted  nucleic acid-binding Zn-ribbon protein